MCLCEEQNFFILLSFTNPHIIPNQILLSSVEDKICIKTNFPRNESEGGAGVSCISN